jgi:rhodanese-related sulfurtransferase
MPENISVEDLRSRLRERRPLVLLDVREAWERRLCQIENSTHIPIEEIEFRTAELDPADEIVVFCHHGVRSAAVADYLRRLGFAKAVNLAGGLDRWAQIVDPSMTRY